MNQKQDGDTCLQHSMEARMEKVNFILIVTLNQNLSPFVKNRFNLISVENFQWKGDCNHMISLNVEKI